MTKKAQIEKFRDKAREIGASQHEAAFNQALRREAKPGGDKDHQPKASGRTNRPGVKYGDSK